MPPSPAAPLADQLGLFVQSLLIGLSIAAPVGQIGILVIQRALQQGRAAGLATGLGAALADAVYGAVGAFGVTAVMAWLLDVRVWLSVGGAVVLLGLAWRIATQPPVAARSSTAPPSRGHLLRHVASTFVLTLSNPSTILSFIAIFSALAGHRPTASPWVMVLGVLLGSALWWLVLSSVVAALRERFDAQWQRRVNLGSALLLAGLALWQLVALAR